MKTSTQSLWLVAIACLLVVAALLLVAKLDSVPAIVDSLMMK